MNQVRVVTVFKYGKRFRFTPSSNKRSRTRAGSCYLVYITLKKSAEFYSVSWPPSNLQLAGTLQVEIVILLRVEISGLSRLKAKANHDTSLNVKVETKSQKRPLKSNENSLPSARNMAAVDNVVLQRSALQDK